MKKKYTIVNNMRKIYGIYIRVTNIIVSKIKVIEEYRILEE